MSVPKVFISSTYYDLKQYRSNIGNFIKSLGYEPIMHEQSKIAYTQTKLLEKDCYTELDLCEIVVCIIGNKFGTKSSESDNSITMEELQNAIKRKKKIYVFILNDVYIENKTYLHNIDTVGFKPVYADNIKIHEYIAELKQNVHDHYISSFETSEDIINTLKLQFAGLFQRLLVNESTMTEAKTVYDLQETAESIRNIKDSIQEVINDFVNEKNSFYDKINCTFIRNNYILTRIKQCLGLTKCAFFARDIFALDEIMTLAGYERKDCNEENMAFEYVKVERDRNSITTKTIYLGEGLFDENWVFKTDCTGSYVESHFRYDESTKNVEYYGDYTPVSDDDLPF